MCRQIDETDNKVIAEYGGYQFKINNNYVGSDSEDSEFFSNPSRRSSERSSENRDTYKATIKNTLRISSRNSFKPKHKKKCSFLRSPSMHIKMIQVCLSM